MTATAPSGHPKPQALRLPLRVTCTVAAICASQNSSVSRGCNKWQQPRLLDIAAICASQNSSVSRGRNRWQQPRLLGLSHKRFHCLCASPARLPQSVHPKTLPFQGGATDGSNRALWTSLATSASIASARHLHGCRNLCIPELFRFKGAQQMAATAPSGHPKPQALRLPLHVTCTVAAICASQNSSVSRGRNRWQQPRLLDILSHKRFDYLCTSPARLPQSVHPKTLPFQGGATNGSNRAFWTT